MNLKIFINLIIILVYVNSNKQSERLKKYMENLNAKYAQLEGTKLLAEWNYMLNITDKNYLHYITVLSEVAKKKKEALNEIQNYDWKTLANYDLKRQFKLYSFLHKEALPLEKELELETLLIKMRTTYAMIKVQDKNNKTKQLDLTEILNTMSKTENSAKLKYLWMEFRKGIGPNVRDKFHKYVDLMNDAARLNNVRDASDLTLLLYEMSDIKLQLNNLWKQVKPFYLQLHAYIRHKLWLRYGNEVNPKGSIPSHLLRNMWSQDWSNIWNIAVPYPESNFLNVTGALQDQGYTPLGMFRTAEDFMTSLRFHPLPRTFWEKSVFVKQIDGQNIDCSGLTISIPYTSDVRILVCMNVKEEHFFQAHWYISLIHVNLQLNNFPYIYQIEHSPYLMLTVANAIILHVKTYQHLQKFSIGKFGNNIDQDIINNQMYVALSSIPYIPYVYVLDMWRWDIFSGKVNESNYNCNWWDLRYAYQGLQPPEDRSEKDFDPAAKIHVLVNEQSIPFYLAEVLQYNLHRSLCIESDQYEPGNPNKPLFQCDIYGSVEAGNLLKETLKLGTSRSFPEVLESLTGCTTLKADSLLEYFDPLIKWLTEENAKNKVYIGWDFATKKCYSGSV